MSVPRCIVCRARIPTYMRALPEHSQECARLLLQRILVSIPGVLDILPEQWRGDRHVDVQLPDDHSLLRRARFRARLDADRDIKPGDVP